MNRVAALALAVAIAVFALPSYSAPPVRDQGTDVTVSLYDAASLLPDSSAGAPPLVIGPFDVSPYKTIRVTASHAYGACATQNAWQWFIVIVDGVYLGGIGPPVSINGQAVISQVFDVPGRALSLELMGSGQGICPVRIQIYGRSN